MTIIKRLICLAWGHKKRTINPIDKRSLLNMTRRLRGNDVVLKNLERIHDIIKDLQAYCSRCGTRL